MTDRWDRVTAIFGAARLLDAAARSSFLDAACGGDIDLRADVDQLLASDVNDAFLAESPWTQMGDAIAAAAELAPGTILKGRYRIDERFAEGGQAVVYRGTDQHLDRTVVIKVTHQKARNGEAIASRLAREMQALSRVDHPGVVGILDVGELSDGRPFLVIQFVKGASLREILASGQLDVGRSAALLRQLGAALGAAHAEGVVHQDLKPENVMVQSLADGTDAVKLIDFGTANIDCAATDPLRATITIVGTVQYMAPEQFMGMNSPASDVYALGLIACEMLTGQHGARALPPQFNARARRLIDAALAWAPESRPSDSRAWSASLADALTGRGWSRRRVVLTTAGAVGLAVALVVAGREFALGASAATRIIEKRGAFDPLEEGFLTHGDIVGTVEPNEARDGFVAWRVTSSTQGHYYQNLSRSQKLLALSRGWSLSARMRVDEGTVFALIDFIGVGRRYDIDLVSAGDHDVVRLNTQVAPVIQGLEWSQPHDRAYHLYELRFDPGLQAAELWVDGHKRLDGYRGHTQYQEDGDFLFGTTAYRSAHGAGAFELVRFEISP